MSPTLLALTLLAAAPQDDRTRIVDGVESWYRVMQDGVNRGYAHEKLERVKDEWSYAYRADFILDVPDPKDPSRTADYAEFWDVTATLDDAFQPTALRALLESGGRKVDYSLATDGDKRALTVGDRTVDLAADAHVFPNLLFYALRQDGRLSRAGRQAVRVFSPREGELVEAEVVFDVELPAPTAGVRRMGSATPVRFVKPFATGHRDAQRTSVRVDKFGRIVELTLRKAAFVLVEDDVEAFRNAVTMHRSDRRDPLEKEAAMRARSTPLPDEPAKVRVSADAVLSTLRDEERLLEALQALKGGDEDELRAAYFKLLDLWKPLREKAQSLGQADVVLKADALRHRAEETWNGAARALADARRSNVRLLEKAERLEPAAVEQELRAMKDQLRRIEFEQRPEGAELSRWIALAEPLAARTRTRSDLARKSIAVSGTVISQAEESIPVEIAAGVTQQVRFVRDTSTAVVNGVMVRVGDTVEGVRLEKVTPFAVTVSLRGEMRDVPIGTK